jgi:uncharacterized protein YfaS (alpha-2-macroglobulin family)
MVDPSGESGVGSLTIGGGFGSLIGGFSAGAVSAAKIKAIAAIGVTAIAIGATLSGDRPNLNQMRLQLQEGGDNYWSLALLAPQETGVTSAQVYAALAAMPQATVAQTTDIAFPMRLEPSLYQAILRSSQRIQPIVAAGGTFEQGKNVIRETVSDRSKLYWIDLENIRGHNLRR